MQCFVGKPHLQLPLHAGNALCIPASLHPCLPATQEGLPSEGIASVLKTLHRLRRAPGIDKMRERVQRYVGLVARFDRPSMLLWVRRYPQLLNHKTSSLLQSIEVGLGGS